MAASGFPPLTSYDWSVGLLATRLERILTEEKLESCKDSLSRTFICQSATWEPLVCLGNRYVIGGMLTAGGNSFRWHFFTQIPLAAKKDSFWWQFYTDSACGDHKTFAWPPNTCRLLFPARLFFLWIFASFQPMPWPVCPWSPLHDCLSTRYAPQSSCMRTSWAPNPPNTHCQ